MRVLLVSQEYPPDTAGGIGAYTQSIATQLATRGHEVHVLSCTEDGSRADELLSGVHVHRRRRLDGTLNRVEPVAERVWTALTVRREAARLGVRPDVVEAPEYLAESWALPRRGVPVVVTLHTPMSLAGSYNVAGPRPDERLTDRVAERIADRMERRVVSRAHVVTSPSQLLVDTLRDSGWLRRPARVVPNPLDLDAWSEAPWPSSGAVPRVLAVGRVEPRKGPLDLVHALAGTKTAHELALVGRSSSQHDGVPYAQHVAAEAARLGVVLTSAEHVDRHDLPGWYASARVLALPSTFDNYPMTVLEAMACGRPVVATTSTGLAAVLREVHRGQVVPPGDPRALAGALRPFLEDVALAREVGAANRRRVEALVVEAVDGREEAYLEAVALGRRGRPPARVR